MPSPGHFAVRRGRASAPIVIFSRGLAVLSFPEARFMLWCILVGFGACLRLEPRGIKGCAKSLSNFLTFIALAVWLALPRRSPSWTALTGASLSMTIGNRRRPTANAIRAGFCFLIFRTSAMLRILKPAPPDTEIPADLRRPRLKDAMARTPFSLGEKVSPKATDVG